MISDFKGEKAPGLDGFSMAFFQSLLVYFEG